MARQRYCRRLARYRHTLRVSADPAAKPAAHTRAESRGSRLSKADAGERRTLRWREMDSNPRSPVREKGLLRHCHSIITADTAHLAPSLMEEGGFERSVLGQGGLGVVP